MTREDPRPLRSQVRAAAVRTVSLLALSVAVYRAVTTYADVAVRLLRSLGLRQRQLEPWRSLGTLHQWPPSPGFHKLNQRTTEIHDW